LGLSALGFIGLPYTFAASGWVGLLSDSPDFTSVVMILTHAFMVLGYIRFIVEADSSVTGLEKYARITFPLGLVILIQTILVLGLIGWPGVLTAGNLYGSLSSLALVGIGFFISWRFGFHLQADAQPPGFPLYRLLTTILGFFRKVLSLSWVSALVRRAYDSLSGLALFFNQIFEGDGGILWSVVFLLVLSIFFLSAGGS